MKAPLCFLLLIVHSSLAQSKNFQNVTHEYKMTTILLRSMNFSDRRIENYIEKLYRFQHPRVAKYLQTIKSASFNLPRLDKTVTNLYSTLEKFGDTNCLIVLNNFKGIDLNPTIMIPVILREFDLAYSMVHMLQPKSLKGYTPAELLWIPKQLISKFNGKFSTDKPIKSYCFSLRFLYSIWPPDETSSRCVGPNTINFILNSKPWQCKVQVELFMPDDLLWLGKPTEIFDELSSELQLYTVPSLRPSVYLLIDSKSGVENYDQISLAAWTCRRNYLFFQHDIASSQIREINRVQITGHVACISKSKGFQLNIECNITKLNALFPCPECQNLVNVHPVAIGGLSFKTISILDKAQKLVSFPAELNGKSGLKLGGLAAHYFDEESTGIRYPLKALRKYNPKLSDKIHKLGFAYASIFVGFFGNFTRGKTKALDNPSYEYFSEFLKRKCVVRDNEYVIANTMLRVENGFAGLKFVSCGSRGIEPFPFIQFVSVFKGEVWLLILISIFQLSFSILKMYKRGAGSSSLSIWPLSIYKVLVEQGDPFPANFDKSRNMRFIMCGILMAGVVISNAFKSENVYKIVLPRGHISYYNIDELMEDNITVYTRIGKLGYELHYFGKPKNRDIYKKHFIRVEKYSVFHLLGWSELFARSHAVVREKSNESVKIRNYASMHPKLIWALKEPLSFLKDLKNIQILTYSAAKRLEKGRALKERFTKIQEKLVTESLNNCSKTAWVLPNYLAQIRHRSLKSIGHHSDVGVSQYTKSELAFKFQSSSYIPSSILEQFSFIPNTGLLDWWPKLINRSDLVVRSENAAPTKPSMSGNILVIFVFLASGTLIAMVCIALEVFLFKFKLIELHNIFIRILDKCANLRNKRKIKVQIKTLLSIPEEILGNIDAFTQN